MGLVISRGQPAYASDISYAPSRANDADYSTVWVTANTPSPAAPAWWAVDLSAVPTNQRTNVMLVWYNDGGAYWQSSDQIISNVFNVPQDYIIEANPAAGGTLPTSGWVTLAQVTGNAVYPQGNYTGREHRLNIAGYNWVRMTVTASAGSVSNYGVAFQLDIHALPYDDWLLLGDSITFEATQHRNLDGTAWNNGPVAQEINTAASTRWPVMIDGGTSTMTMAWAAQHVSDLISPFPGWYVSINYGTNDLNQGFAMSNSAIAAIYANLLTIIDAVHQAGKIAVVPYCLYGTANSGFLGVNAKAFNDYVNAHLSVDRPYAVRGPDLYTPFYNNPALLRDGIHPTYSGTAPTGYDTWHQTYRDWYVANYATLPTPVTSKYVPEVLASFNGAKTRIQAVRSKMGNVQQGSVVDSSVTVSHDDASPIIISAVSVLVTFPDGTSTTYSEANGDVKDNNSGLLTLTYTSKGVGTHTEDWTITDSNNSVAKYRFYTSAVL